MKIYVPADIWTERRYFDKSCRYNILEIRLHFEQAPIFYACANILGKRQCLDNFCNKFCLILLLQIFVYIFSIYLCIFVCANVFGATVLKPRFKIDVVIMII